MADLTGFEPATSGLTGRRALQAAPQVLVRTSDVAVQAACLLGAFLCRLDVQGDPRRASPSAENARVVNKNLWAGTKRGASWVLSTSGLS